MVHVFPSYHGGSEEYYEIYKALNTTNQPEFLYFIYTRGEDIIVDASVTLWVCDEIYKDQCISNETVKCVFDKESQSYISKTLCNKVDEPSKSSCEKAVTSTPSLTKCIYEDSNEQSNMPKNCSIKKLCIASLTEEECKSAITMNPESTRCIFNNQENICEIKEICELEENPSLAKCELILTSSPSEKKCEFDTLTEKCIIKAIIPKNESESELKSDEISGEINISDDQIICFFDHTSNQCELFICDRMEYESVICNKNVNFNTRIKCVFNETQKICKKEEKICNEIDYGATKDICLSAKVSNGDKICILNNETNCCNEVNKDYEESGNFLKNINLLLSFLYLLLFI